MKLTINKEVTIDVVVIVEHTAAIDYPNTSSSGDAGHEPEPAETEIIKVLLGGYDITSALKVAGFDMNAFHADIEAHIENEIYEGGQDE